MKPKKPARKNRNAAALGKLRWRGVSKAKRSAMASKLVSARWARLSKLERSKQVPRTGGKPRKYPPCKRYAYHSFSPLTRRCPCGFTRPAE
jgi:hypothetical protein